LTGKGRVTEVFYEVRIGVTIAVGVGFMVGISGSHRMRKAVDDWRIYQISIPQSLPRPARIVSTLNVAKRLRVDMPDVSGQMPACECFAGHASSDRIAKDWLVTHSLSSRNLDAAS
jgi:hypothetical protein